MKDIRAMLKDLSTSLIRGKRGNAELIALLNDIVTEIELIDKRLEIFREKR